MGEFNAGPWIISIVAYYFFFFVVVWSILNAQAAMGIHDTRLSANDPGFQSQQAYFAGDFGSRCEGSGLRAMTIVKEIPCTRIRKNSDGTIDPATCEAVEGCQYDNGTNLFNLTVLFAGCEGNVNLSYYNISDESFTKYCTNSNFTNEWNCETLGCEWVSLEDILNQEPDPTGSQVVTLWNTIKFVVDFRTDVGFSVGKFIFSFVFFFLPLIALIWAIYMAIPIIH